MPPPSTLQDFMIELGKEILRDTFRTIGLSEEMREYRISQSSEDDHIEAAYRLRHDRNLQEAFEALGELSRRANRFFAQEDLHGGLLAIMTDLSSYKEQLSPLASLPYHYPMGILKEIAKCETASEARRSAFILQGYCDGI